MRPFLAQAADVVSLPLSYLIGAVIALGGAIGTLFLIREKERDKWFERVQSATQAIEGLNDTVDKLTAAVDQMTAEVTALKAEVGKLREELARMKERTP